MRYVINMIINLISRNQIHFGNLDLISSRYGIFKMKHWSYRSKSDFPGSKALAEISKCICRAPYSMDCFLLKSKMHDHASISFPKMPSLVFHFSPVIPSGYLRCITPGSIHEFLGGNLAKGDTIFWKGRIFYDNFHFFQNNCQIVTENCFVFWEGVTTFMSTCYTVKFSEKES